MKKYIQPYTTIYESEVETDILTTSDASDIFDTYEDELEQMTREDIFLLLWEDDTIEL